MSEAETKSRGFIGRDGEKEVVSQKRRKNKARRERGTIFCSEEGARDSIRRASLILESETTGWETEPLIFRHHFSFASSLLLPRDGREVNGTPARFVDMQGKFFEDNTFDNEILFMYVEILKYTRQIL